MRVLASTIFVLSAALAVVACGPTPTGDDDDDDDDQQDAAIDTAAIDSADIDAPDIDAPDLPIDAAETDAQICPDHTCTTPVVDGCVANETCNNGTDDNCNGQVDEGCLCTPGAVQACFRGQPGRRHVGACVDGMQTCTGSGEFTMWGPCTGGIAPGTEACDSQDNNCNGCVDDDPSCCIVELACPGPGDMPDGQPYQNYVIDGTAFFSGQVQSWSWDVTGGPCDQLFLTTTSPVTQSFTITGQTSSMLTIHPTLSGDYTVHVRITAVGGMIYECTFIVHIAGPGFRVELCSDRSADTDIDLHMHRPGTTTNFFTGDDCYFSNCASFGSISWGYANSPLAECSGGPQGASWQALGYCRNPRLDIDSIYNNGTPENINVDNPSNGQSFRVMVHYWGGSGAAHPMVNVYCGGYLRGSYGAAPDVVPNFDTPSSSTGDIWRVVDGTVTVVAGMTTDCSLVPLHPPSMTTGYWVNNVRTYN